MFFSPTREEVRAKHFPFGTLFNALSSRVSGKLFKLASLAPSALAGKYKNKHLRASATTANLVLELVEHENNFFETRVLFGENFPRAVLVKSFASRDVGHVIVKSKGKTIPLKICRGSTPKFAKFPSLALEVLL